MTNNTKEKIRDLVGDEYVMAARDNGEIHNTCHESYGVLLEEYEETQTEDRIFASQLSSYWELIKHNVSFNDKLVKLQAMKDTAINAACEWIQVAAMCEKAMRTSESLREYNVKSVLAHDNQLIKLLQTEAAKQNIAIEKLAKMCGEDTDGE